jgi:hypothetical protein
MGQRLQFEHHKRIITSTLVQLESECLEMFTLDVYCDVTLGHRAQGGESFLQCDVTVLNLCNKERCPNIISAFTNFENDLIANSFVFVNKNIYKRIHCLFY